MPEWTEVMPNGYDSVRLSTAGCRLLAAMMIGAAMFLSGAIGMWGSHTFVEILGLNWLLNSELLPGKLVWDQRI